MPLETVFSGKIAGKTALGALMLGVVFSATSASALSINFSSTDGSTFSISDNDGSNDTNPATGLIDAEDFTVGGFTIDSVAASEDDADGESQLTSTGLSFSGGEEDEELTMVTSGVAFTGGDAAPSQSDLFFSLATSVLGGTLEGEAQIGSNTLGTISFDPTDGDANSSALSDLAVLPDGFDMSSTLVFGEQAVDEITSITSTVSATAPVPLPAGAWLLLTGVGGIAALRKRRRAA